MVLLRSQQPNNQELISRTFDLKFIGSTMPGLAFYLTRPDKYLLLNKDQRRGQLEDGLQDPLWLLRVPGHVFWIDQCTGYVPGLY